ncbi:SusC/RagA family TonB-linked outer membrane protein [Autumnicola edwardsiae]|uniref:TonB-dependent receptor n=1 Tax=Autumnicola edwardsiae TaxID=3075594 RepID=A0ABU3CXG6_9FLAO|nr:TonB-dependent receptor [Zunongwangia sp. F297]MDT0651062.1 TonB-dependent receptor [Zunongwangia sp. F297]
MKSNRLLKKHFYLAFCLLVCPGVMAFSNKMDASTVFDSFNNNFILEEPNLTNSLDFTISENSNDQRSIEGKVVDDNGLPLPGATVMERGTNNGTVTDFDGNFSLNVSGPDAVLVVEFLGYVNQEITVGSQDSVTISLEPNPESLNEVVLVSYGRQSTRNLTSSVSTVDAESVQDVVAAEFGQQLQGRVAGLQATQATGRPGNGFQFRIRGAASFSSGFQPLIVVDGQPLAGGVDQLDPNQIETFTVLKDAAATALYGSRASNGVILITTKQAIPGKTSISLNASYGWQTVPERGRPDLMNARQFATYMNGLYEDRARYEDYTGGIPDDYVNPERYGEGTDWYDAIYRTAPIQNYSVNISSGTDKLSSSTTISYFNQEGVLLNTGVERFSLRSNNEYRPSDHFTIGLNIAPSYQENLNTEGRTDGSRYIIGNATSASPLVPIYDEEGNFNSVVASDGMLSVANPVEQMLLRNGTIDEFRVLSNLYAEIEILDNLRFNSSFNIDLGSSVYNEYFGSHYGAGLGVRELPHPPSQNLSLHESDNYLSWVNENTLTYNLDLNDHSFEFLAGQSSQKYERRYRSMRGSNFAGDQVPLLSGAAVTSGTNNLEEWSLASLFGRINYNFLDRYLISGTIRQDGSSRFGANEKYGVFPSISAGWIASDENFFPENRFVKFLKFRGSYGETGNFNIGNYQQISNISSTNYVFGGSLTPGLSLSNIGNRNLTWEVSRQADFGVDMRLLDNRVSFSYDYYNKTTEGMLYDVPIPRESGFNSITTNTGEFEMWGHEFVLSTVNFDGAFSWNTNFNISFNDNEVVELPPNTPFIGGGGTYSGFNRSVEGGSIGEFYGYVFDGIYMTEEDLENYPTHSTSALGSARMRDVNGDGVITADDRTLIGNPNPDYIFGMNNTFGYKNFDFTIDIAGQVGNEIMNVSLQDLHNNDGVFNMSTDMINRWRSPTDQGDGETPGTRSGSTELYRLANTTWVSDGSFLAIKNIALGYTFNVNDFNFMQSARLYLAMQQAFVFTNYSGQNPEVNIDRDDVVGRFGQDLSTTPVPRRIVIGANIRF